MSKVRESSPKKQIKKNNGQSKWTSHSKSNYLSLQVEEDGKPINVGKQSSLSYRKTELSQSLLQEQDFSLITTEKKPSTHTYSKKHNSKQSKITPPKDLPSPSSKSQIKSSDSRFVIQSQPNSLIIDRNLYFNDQETDYRSIVRDKQTNKEMSALKLMRLLCKVDFVMYTKKIAFINIKNILIKYKQSCTNQEQIQKRQLDLLNKLLGKADQAHSLNQFGEIKIPKVKIPYYNKLVGLCNPLLIKKQKLIKSGNVVQEVKKEKESTCLNQTPKSQKSFIFNFQITPKPPVKSEKRIVKSSYLETTKSHRKVS